MFKTILTSALLVLCAQSQAGTQNISVSSLAVTIAQSVRPQGINWTIGDSADYNLSGGIMNGTMHMFVREAVTEGFWLQQDLNLGFLGAHKAETLIDKNSGKVLEMLMDGQKQTPPDPADEEIVDSHKDNVTVPKGTFDCMWVKMHDKKQNTDSQIWVNPMSVPITGMIKTIAPTQMGDMTIELTDFKRN